MPYTPGDEIAQGAPADIGSLNPIAALIKLLMGAMGGPAPVPPPAPSPWAQGGAPGEMSMPQPQPGLKGKMTQGR